MITWVPSVIDTCDLQTIDFDYLAQAISGSTYKKKCEKIRAITDRTQRNILKADTLPAFSMCTFDGLGRDEDHVLTVNGLTLDYDECNGNADQIWKAMQAAGARLIFNSPSGNGVKASFEYSRSISKQEHDRIKYDITHGMKLKAGHKLCNCSSSAVQLCFLSNDPDIILQAGKPIDVDALLTHAKKDPYA